MFVSAGCVTAITALYSDNMTMFTTGFQWLIWSNLNCVYWPLTAGCNLTWLHPLSFRYTGKKKALSGMYVFKQITIILGGAKSRMKESGTCFTPGEVNPAIKMSPQKKRQQLIACSRSVSDLVWIRVPFSECMSLARRLSFAVAMGILKTVTVSHASLFVAPSDLFLLMSMLC